MVYNFYFVFAATVLYAAMIFSVLYKRATVTSSGRMFLGLLFLGLISSVSSVLALSTKFGYIVTYVSSTIYFVSRAFVAVCFCVYIIIITDNIHKYRKHFSLVLLLLIPFLIVLGFAVSNYFTNLVFTIEDNQFIRKEFITYGGIYLEGLIYFLICFIYIMVYRKFFDREKFTCLLLAFPLQIVACVVQYFLPNILVEIFATAIECLLVLNMLERPEIFFETEIGLKKYAVFASDSYKAMTTRKEVTLVFIKVVNDINLTQKLTYEQQTIFRRTIGSIIKDTAKDFSLKGEFYWLGQGQYSAAVTGKQEQNFESYAMTLRRRLNVPVKTSFGIMDIYANVALARCPYDIDTSDKSLAFIENFYHINGVLDDVLNLSNMEDKKDFEIKMNLSTIIKQAIMNDSLEVYYQPIYSTKDNAFTRAEALLRLQDERYGFIPPSLFLPEAERNGTIYKIGDIVFDQVCKFIASDEFEKCGLEKIEVNLSVVQCMHEDLPIHLMDVIKRYNISPDKINLDITEAADPYSRKMMDENIKILKELGFSFSLDDYGTGYSNIDNVTSLPLETIKVDNLHSNNENPDVKVMIDHSIQMIKDLKRKIVVEGVETEEMLNSYEGYLCDYIQGFYFSKPLPRKDFVAFVLKENQERKEKKTEETA